MSVLELVEFVSGFGICVLVVKWVWDELVGNHWTPEMEERGRRARFGDFDC